MDGADHASSDAPDREHTGRGETGEPKRDGTRRAPHDDGYEPL
jgi:hypothetical protein